MPHSASLSSWTRIALVLIAVAAIARGVALVRHDPLLAYANSYDQIRYTACLGLAPWRPGVAPDLANTAAPYSRFAFQPLPAGWCVWTSDLALTAPVALAWRAAEALGGRPIHSVRRLGELRLLLWLAAALWATSVFLRERRADIAIAHLAGFAVVAMDSANTLYLSTFYAEGMAAFALYLCGIGAVAAALRPTRTALAVAAVGAFLLATSKYQHLVLPLLIGAAAMIGARRDVRRVALALLAAGALGGALQWANGMRQTPAARSIVFNNRADYVMSVLLVETSNAERIRDALAIDDACAAFVGRNVYWMPGPVEKTCPTVDRWRDAVRWGLLVSDPPALGRALLHIPRELLPWQPDYLGVVEDADRGRRPPSAPSLAGLFGGNVAVASLLLALPWLVLALGRAFRATEAARRFVLACAVGSIAVPVIALFGDGDVELAKHAHLAIDFALASLCVPLAALLRRLLATERAA